MSDTMTFSFDDVDNSLDFAGAPEVEEKVLIAEPEAKEEEKAGEPATKEEEKNERLYLEIYDAIMFEDKWERTVSLGKKYNCVLGTRSADADISISRQLDNMSFSTVAALQTMSAVLTLSHSLQELNGKDLRSMTVPKRYEFIRSRPSHLIERLSFHMVDFDTDVRAALEYGETNF